MHVLSAILRFRSGQEYAREPPISAVPRQRNSQLDSVTKFVLQINIETISGSTCMKKLLYRQFSLRRHT